MNALSLCIVAYKSPAVLRECLTSITTHTPPSLRVEVIVVDNGSEDGTVEMLRSAFPWVTVIENKRNVGFSKATNQAIQASTGRYVAWLNADTVLIEDCFGPLISFLDFNPDVGVVGPMVLNPDLSFQPQCRRGLPTPFASFAYLTGLHRIFPRSPFFCQYLLSHLPCNLTADVTAVSGCCLLLRRELISTTGPLDESLFLDGEDLDWCLRARKTGSRVVYLPQARIVHLRKHGGTQVNPRRRIEARAQSLWHFYQKHFQPNYSLLTTAAVYCGIRLYRLASSVRLRLMRS